MSTKQQAVATTSAGELAEPEAGSPAAVLAVIERAAANPDVDVDKMQKLLDMQERILDKRAEQEFWEAFAEMQPKLPSITERGEIKDKYGKVVSKYARYDEDIKPIITPILSAHGFTLMHQSIGENSDEVVMRSTLAHRGGHKETTTFHLKPDTSGYKNPTQGMGSARSYAKRYNAEDMLDIASGGQDDDGNAAGEKGLPKEKIKQLNDAIDQAKDKDKILTRIKKHYGVDNIGEIPEGEFNTVLIAINKIVRKEQGGNDASH